MAAILPTMHEPHTRYKCMSPPTTMLHQIYETQKQIEKEAKSIRSEISRLNTNVATLQDLLRSASSALKEVGDFENYLNVVEQEVEAVAQRAERLLPDKQQHSTAGS